MFCFFGVLFEEKNLDCFQFFNAVLKILLLNAQMIMYQKIYRQKSFFLSEKDCLDILLLNVLITNLHLCPF